MNLDPVHRGSGDLHLVVGADGLIGGALALYLKRAGVAVIETTRRPEAVSTGRIHLDLSRLDEGWPVDPVPRVAYLCAGVARLDRCRKDPDGTRRVNVESLSRLASFLVARGTFVVGLSTSAVFDGGQPRTPAGAALAPRSEYGRQHAQREHALLGLGDRAAVVRLTKVVGRSLRLLDDWALRLDRGHEVVAFADVRMSPVPVACVVEALFEIGRRGLSGLFQISGDVDVSFAEVARELARERGKPVSLIRAVPARSIQPDLEWLPASTTLDPGRACQELALRIPPVSATVWNLVDAARAAHLEALFASIRGGPVTGIGPAGAGGNSRVFRIETPDGTLAGKLYRDDGRPRLATEVQALRFLAEHGIARVPRVVAARESESGAIFTFVPGRRLDSGAATREHLSQMCDFLARLGHLSRTIAGDDLPRASESCVSEDELRRVIERRREALGQVMPSSPSAVALGAYLRDAFDGVWERIGGRRDAGPPLPRERQVLSPSDFGLHNCLIDGDDRVWFLDFEYFGWDDPAKMIADVVCHPGSALAPDQRAFVAARLLRDLPADPDLPQRFARRYPLIAINWALITLNPFLRAAGDEADREPELLAQLAKSRTMLDRAVALDAPC